MSSGEKTALETLKERLPELDVSIENTASQIQNYTGARRTTIASALNDFALNVEDGAGEVAEIVKQFRDGQITSRTDFALAILDVAERDRLEMTGGAAVGAYFGALTLGPIGAILGAAAGPSIVYIRNRQDGRRLVAIPLQSDDVPDNVEPTSSSEPPLKDSGDLQAILREALEKQEAVDHASSLTRTIDFEDIESRLEKLEYIEPGSDEYYDGYYVELDGVIFVIFVAESIEDT